MSMFTNYENNNTYTAYNITPKIITINIIIKVIIIDFFFIDPPFYF